MNLLELVYNDGTLDGYLGRPPRGNGSGGRVIED